MLPLDSTSRSGLTNMLDESQKIGFLEDTAMLNTPESFAAFVRSTDVFTSVRGNIESGTLTGSDIRLFVEDLLHGFQVGKTFYGDKLLALIAHVVQSGPEPFAGRYLNELSALECAELPISTRVAKLALDERRRFYPETLARTWEISSPIATEAAIEYEPEVATNGVTDNTVSNSLNWAA